MTETVLAVGIFAAAFAIGVYSSWGLWLIHRDETPPRNLITRAFVVVAILVTLAAGYYGLLSARRLLGYEPIPGSAIASILLASAILLIPAFLRLTVAAIRRSRA